MRAVELVVPVGRDHDRGHHAHPVAEHPQHVECCLVCPVEVFEDEHERRAPLSGPHHRRGDLVGPRGCADRGRHRRQRGLGDVEERSGRGVCSGSQPPQRTEAAPESSSQKRRTSAVFPTPASPPTSRSRPRPFRACSSAVSRVARGSSRSRSTRPARIPTVAIWRIVLCARQNHKRACRAAPATVVAGAFFEKGTGSTIVILNACAGRGPAAVAAGASRRS